MEAPLAYWLTVVERLVQARIGSVLEEHGVTRIQWRVLSLLENGPCALDELERLASDVPRADDEETTASAVAELVESAWVLGTSAAHSLSEAGAGALRRMTATVTELRASALEGITPEQEAVVIAALQRIAENLDESR